MTSNVYGKTWTWTYDNAGNITSRNEYAYTTGELGDPLDTVIYAYTAPDWGDLLTSYDGTAITYDTIGNPLYDGTWTYTWEHGRRLASMTDGTTTWSYSYNADGLRTGRTDGTNTYQYVYTDGQLSAMYYEGTRYLFHYEGSTPVAMHVGGTPYYYAANINGDVVAIFDNDGNRVVEYTYDAWGNILSVSGSMADTIGAINPMRYRGYVYDRETGLYYLQSRYYNPTWGRFINADNYPSTGQGLLGNNMFAYCGNNPVSRIDSNGEAFETFFDVISLGASVFEVCINPTDPWAWAGLVGDAIDLIPFVTGVGEITRAVKTIDKVADTVQIAKAVDFTEDAADIVKMLDRSSGFTKSTASAGRKIHQGYKATSNFPSIGKEFREIKGIRPDYIDFNTKTIYELKPMNPRGVRSGIRQLQKYNKALGGGFNLVLELY